MRRIQRLIDLYWQPSLILGLGLLASTISLLSDHQSYLYRPNLYGLLLLSLCFLSTHGSRDKKARLFFAFTGLLIAILRLWAFFTVEPFEQLFFHWINNPWMKDMTLLPLNYAVGASGFYLFQIIEEIYFSPRNRRIWTGIAGLLIFSYVSVGTLRPLFHNGKGYYLFSLARVQPYDALCIQALMAFYFFRTWYLFKRLWDLIRIPLIVSALGAALLAISVTGIEKQIYTIMQNEMDRKITDIQAALQKNIEERLTLISIFGDFLNADTHPTEEKIYNLMDKLNTSDTDAAPTVYFFDPSYNLKWIYRDNQLLEGDFAQLEILGRKHIFIDYLQEMNRGGPKYLPQITDEGHSVCFSSRVLHNNKTLGFLIFEDLVQPRIESFFSKNDFGPFNLYVMTQEGLPFYNELPPYRPSVALQAKLNYLDEPLLLTITPNRSFAINTVLIPQVAFVFVGLLVIVVLIYTIYVNRQRVRVVEREVQERVQELKVLKEEADRAKLMAEHASYAKSQFLANMSHEIRTPLNVLLGASELLAETSLDPEQKKYVEMFQTSGKHLLGLLNDIIDLSRIESGQLETEKISFDLAQTVDFVRNLFSVKAEEQGLTFIVDSSRLTQKVRTGDPLRIRQILVNLIGNAFKFTKSGTVRLTIIEMAGSAVQFWVEDSGTGIPENKLNEVFETFQQGDASFSRKHGGAGLGLAISKNLCQIMGGNIELQSKVGVGSKFIVTIPLPLSTEPPSPAYSLPIVEPPEEASSSTIQNILLVDDSDDNRFLVKLFLQNSHYHISEAKNGEEAVDMVKRKPFDIILMDMQMPVMDGYEAVKIIRQYEDLRGQDKRVPILALTAHGTGLERTRCLEIGCTDYLSKPVSKKALLHRISDLTTQSGDIT